MPEATVVKHMDNGTARRSLFPAIRGARGNRFCGPAALASVFGLSTEETARAIRDVTGKVKVFGLHPTDMTRTLDTLCRTHGCTATRMRHDTAQRVLHGTLATLPEKLDPGLYIVHVTGHYVALDTRAREVCDNATIYPLALARYRQRGKHVKQAWRIQ